MDIFSVMQERKSIRAFLDKPVSRNDIEKIFTYASMAPSAINIYHSIETFLLTIMLITFRNYFFLYFLITYFFNY